MPFREAQAEYQTVGFFFLLRQRIVELAAEIRPPPPPPPPPAGRVNVLCEPLFAFSLGTICLY